MMFKKPIFWVIVVLILIIIWYVFMGRGKIAHTVLSKTPNTTVIVLPNPLKIPRDVTTRTLPAAKDTPTAEANVLSPNS